MKAFTVSTIADHPNLPVLRASALKWGFDLHEVGTDFKGRWRNPLKLPLCRQAVDALGLPDSETIVVLDAFDSFFVGPPHVLHQVLASSKHDLVYGVESMCWPEQNKKLYPRDASVYLNGGLLVTSVGALRELMNTYGDRFTRGEERSEQNILHPLMFETTSPSIGIDASETVFVNMLHRPKGYPPVEFCTDSVRRRAGAVGPAAVQFAYLGKTPDWNSAWTKEYARAVRKAGFGAYLPAEATAALATNGRFWLVFGLGMLFLLLVLLMVVGVRSSN